MNHFRCVICNKVNNISVQTNIGDYIGGKGNQSFVQDYKHDNAFICFECDDIIQDTLYEYHKMDMEKYLKDLEDED